MTGPRDRLLRRAETARMLGVSVSTLRRRVEGVTLQPIVDEHGVHRFEPKQVEAVRESFRVTYGRTQPPDPGDPRTIDPNVGAEVYEEFNKGATQVDVVVRLRLHPLTVEWLYKTWARMRGSFVMDPEGFDRFFHVLIERVTVTRDEVRDGTNLAELLWKFEDAVVDEKERDSLCTECKKRPAKFCPACAEEKFIE